MFHKILVYIIQALGLLIGLYPPLFLKEQMIRESYFFVFISLLSIIIIPFFQGKDFKKLRNKHIKLHYSNLDIILILMIMPIGKTILNSFILGLLIFGLFFCNRLLFIRGLISSKILLTQISQSVIIPVASLLFLIDRNYFTIYLVVFIILVLILSREWFEKTSYKKSLKSVEFFETAAVLINQLSINTAMIIAGLFFPFYLPSVKIYNSIYNMLSISTNPIKINFKTALLNMKASLINYHLIWSLWKKSLVKYSFPYLIALLGLFFLDKITLFIPQLKILNLSDNLILIIFLFSIIQMSIPLFNVAFLKLNLSKYNLISNAISIPITILITVLLDHIYLFVFYHQIICKSLNLFFYRIYVKK